MSSTFKFNETQLLRAKKVFDKTGHILCCVADWAHTEKCHMNPEHMNIIGQVVGNLSKSGWDIKKTWSFYMEMSKQPQQCRVEEPKQEVAKV